MCHQCFCLCLNLSFCSCVFVYVHKVCFCPVVAMVPPAQVTFLNSHNLSLSTVLLPRGRSGVITTATSSEWASGLKCREMNSTLRTWSHRHLLRDPCLDRTADEYVWSAPISSSSVSHPSTLPHPTPTLLRTAVQPAGKGP